MKEKILEVVVPLKEEQNIKVKGTDRRDPVTRFLEVHHLFRAVLRGPAFTDKFDMLSITPGNT